MAGTNISETAITYFNKQIHKKFLENGNQLKKVLGTKWKVSTSEAKDIRFLITTEALSMEKPAVGSLVTQSKGGKITSVTVTPKTYIVNSFVDQLEKDSTNINLTAEFEDIHARAMGLRTDMVILETIIKATFLDTNKFTGVELDKYDGETGLVNIVKKTAAVGGAATKYLIVDSAAHGELLKNEQFINNDYATGGVVKGGSLDGQERLGYTILLLNDLDADFHGTSSLLTKCGATNKVYIVTEESIGAGTHQESSKTTITKEALVNGDYLISTNMSLATQVLVNRAMWEISYV